MATYTKDWLPAYSVRQRRSSKSIIAIESCGRVPENVSAVWVEVGIDGFAARGRIMGENKVEVVSPPTRHYSIALARAEAWAATYKVSVVHVIALSESDARLLWLV